MSKRAGNRYPSGSPPTKIESSGFKRFCKIPVAVIPATQSHAGPMRTSEHLDKRDSTGRSGTTGSESSNDVEVQELMHKSSLERVQEEVSSEKKEKDEFDEMIRNYQRRMFRDSSRERRLQKEQSEEDLMEEGYSTPEPEANRQRASGGDEDDDIQVIEQSEQLAAAKKQKLEEYKDDEDLLTGKFAKIIPRDPQVFPQHNPRRKLPPKNNLEFTRHRQKIIRFVEMVYGLPRPVSYRMKAFNSERIRQFNSKRTRVTRQIWNNKISQFHLEDENTNIKNVPEKSLAETIDSYLEESKKHIQKSTRFYDQVLATAVEYENTVKMLHFGQTVKKYSCKQKRLKFQSNWWYSPKKYRTKKKPKGFFKTPNGFCYKISSDEVLFRNHGTFSDNQPSPIHKIYRELQPRLMRRRTTDDIILDSSYFVREFFLSKSSISLRITRSSDIPSCFAPPTLRCGYFPLSAESIENKKCYLAERFKEAQMEYLNLTYRQIIPPSGFKPGTITKNELWTFHKLGKHIHGFWVVWMDRHNYYEDEKGRTMNRRYLVDMFSHQHFPLHVKYRSWEPRLKQAFDKVTAYNLNLAEVIRANRPVFDSISENPSVLKPITLGEILCSLNEQEIIPKYYINTVGKREFYDWGLASTNANYLSAFLIICGGTKVARPIRTYDLEKYRVFKADAMRTGVLTKNGKLYLLNIAHKPSEFLIHVDNFKNELDQEELPIRPPLSVEGAKVTRIISDTPQNPETVPKPKAKKAVREKRVCLNRTELMKVRKRIYNHPDTVPVKTKEKQKERKPPGRKPKTRVKIGIQSHNFDSGYMASDIESEYEGYLSNDEMTAEVRRPRLIRSQSAESIHLDINYTDYYVNALSTIHSTRFDFVDHPIAKKKKRKMKRKVIKHTGRFRELQKESHAFKELMECYQGNFPCGVKAVAMTKSSIRNGTYDRNNIPRAYVKGDQPLIDIVFRAVKDLVTSVVGEQLSITRRQIGMDRLLQEQCIARIEAVENLPTTSPLPLPAAPHLAMELLTRKKITGGFTLNQERADLRRMVGDSVNKYLSLPSYHKEYLFNLAMQKRHEFEFHAFWKNLMGREIQLDRTLKLLPFDPQSLHALNENEEKRRQSRLRHAQKIAAQKKLINANATKKDFEALDMEIERMNKERVKRELADKIHALKMKETVKKLQVQADKRREMLEERRMNSYIEKSREHSICRSKLSLKIEQLAKLEGMEAANRLVARLRKEKRRLAEKSKKKREKEEEVRKQKELQLAKESSMKHPRDLNDSRLKDIEEPEEKEFTMKFRELFRAEKGKRRLAELQAKSVMALDDLSMEIVEHRGIRREFKESDLLRIIRNAGETFYLALKHITSRSLLYFYLQNYVNTEKRSIDIPENLLPLFDNIARSFKWNIAEKIWFFDFNLTFLLENVETIIQTEIEELMEDPEVLQDEARVLPQRLIQRVSNQSWMMGAPWVPPVPTTTKFWELMNQSRNANSLEEEVHWTALLENHIFGNQDLPLQSLQWIYAIFGVSCVLLTGKAEDASIAADPEKTFFKEPELENFEMNAFSIESILRHLLTSSMYFQEANVYPVNTKALCVHDGFKEVISCVKKVYRHIIYLVVRFNLMDLFKPGTSIEDALCEVFLKIGDKIQSLIEVTFKLPPLEIEELRKSGYHASLSALTNRGFAIPGARNHSEEQKEYTVMINTVLNWYTAFKDHHNQEYSNLKTETLEHLQCELRAREMAPLPGERFPRLQISETPRSWDDASEPSEVSSDSDRNNELSQSLHVQCELRARVVAPPPGDAIPDPSSDRFSISPAPPVSSPEPSDCESELSQSLDTPSSQKSPPMVSCAKDRIRRLYQDIPHDFSDLPPRTIRFRSKSVEFSISSPVVITRCQSTCTLNEISTYARRRVEKTMGKYDDIFDSTETPDVREARQDLLRAELLDSRMFEADGISDFSIKKKCGLITSMLKCGNINDRKYEMVAALRRYKLITNATTRNNSFQIFRGDEDVISLVMAEYQSYLDYRKKQMATAEQMMRLFLTDVKPLVRSNAALLLYATHEKIFNLNLSLFEHLLHLICQHTFNPLAIYYAVKNQNVDHILESLDALKQKVPLVMNALFNMETLKRQLREMSQLEVHHETQTMENLARELSRIAIERVRIPQSVKVKELNNFPWINAKSRFNNTIDLMRLSSTHTASSVKELFKFLVKDIDSNQLTNFDNTKLMENLFQGLFDQSEQFFGDVAIVMPNKSIDIKMKAFYQNLVITRVLEVFFFVFVSYPGYQDKILDTAVFLDLLHRKFLLEKKEEVPLLIQPALIGITFSCLENNRIFVSLVKEDEFKTSNIHPLQTPIRKENEIQMTTKSENLKLSMIVNNDTNGLSIAFHSQLNPNCFDRAPFGFLPARPQGSQISWKFVLETLINPNFNGFSRYLKQETMSMKSNSNLGRVEHPALNAVPETLKADTPKVVPSRNSRETRRPPVWSMSPSLEIQFKKMKFGCF